MSLGIERKPDPEPEGARGVLDELRAVYDAIDTGENQTEVFDVPGTRFAVRYRRLGYEDSMKALGGDGAAWECNAQFLIDACDEILARAQDGTLEPVKPGAKVTFAWAPDSEPLHAVLGRDEPDVRRSVLRFFQGAERVLLLHAQAVDAWMDSLLARAEEKFEGG
jgi:hypothetical protein